MVFYIRDYKMSNLKSLERDRQTLKQWIKEDKGTPLERMYISELITVKQKIKSERKNSGKR